jgi:proline iminopeptidase
VSINNPFSRKHRLKDRFIMSGYTHSDPFDTGTLAVGTIHHLHYEQYGNPDGKPGSNPSDYVPV